MGEDSLKGSMELSQEDRWVWLGIALGKLVLSEDLTCASHQEMQQGDRRKHCLVKALQRREDEENCSLHQPSHSLRS